MIALGKMTQYRGSAFASQPGDFILARLARPGIVRSPHAGEIAEGRSDSLCVLHDDDNAAPVKLTLR